MCKCHIDYLLNTDSLYDLIIDNYILTHLGTDIKYPNISLNGGVGHTRVVCVL